MTKITEDWQVLFVLHTNGRILFHPTGTRRLNDAQFEEFNRTNNPTKIWVRGDEIRFSDPEFLHANVVGTGVNAWEMNVNITT